METEDRAGLISVERQSEDKAKYPGIGSWPQIPRWKRIAKTVLGARTARGEPIKIPGGGTGRIIEDMHLPGWRRVRVRKHSMIIEWAVPIAVETTLHVLWDTVLPQPNLGPIRQLIGRLR